MRKMIAPAGYGLTTPPLSFRLQKVLGIPKKLYYDMMDTRNDFNVAGSPLNDAVSNFTIQQIFNPLQSDVSSPQQYRDRLLQQTGLNQQVINLFSEYHY